MDGTDKSVQLSSEDQEFAELAAGRSLDIGIDLLRNSVQDYDFVQPALDYMAKAYNHERWDIPPGTPPSIPLYEASRNWLRECRRVCNEMSEGGEIQDYAEALAKQRDDAERQLDESITFKARDSQAGVTIVAGAGPGFADYMFGSMPLRRSYTEALPTVEERVRRAIDDRLIHALPWLARSTPHHAPDAPHES